MKGIIEAGVVLFIVYLFLQWEKNGGAAGPGAGSLSLPAIFKEAPGSPAQGLINESAAPGTAGNTATTTVPKTNGGCGCGGAS
jgi:hypothetical protein